MMSLFWIEGKINIKVLGYVNIIQPFLSNQGTKLIVLSFSLFNHTSIGQHALFSQFTSSLFFLNMDTRVSNSPAIVFRMCLLICWWYAISGWKICIKKIVHLTILSTSCMNLHPGLERNQPLSHYFKPFNVFLLQTLVFCSWFYK